MRVQLSDGETVSYTVTDQPPAWSRSRRPAGHGHQFYISADVSCGWPYRTGETLCKLGVTRVPLPIRCAQHQLKLRATWDIEADMQVVFAASGRLATEEVEEWVRDHTQKWLPEDFGQQAEWRFCCPRQLARLAVLIAEQVHDRRQLGRF